MAPHRMLVVVCVFFSFVHIVNVKFIRGTNLVWNTMWSFDADTTNIYSFFATAVLFIVTTLLLLFHLEFIHRLIIANSSHQPLNACGEKFQFTHLLQMNQVAKIHIRWTSSIIGCMLHQAQRQWMQGALEHYTLVWHVCCIVTSRENEEDWLMMEKFGLFINELLTCLHSENVLVTIWNDETIPKKLYELEF